MDAARLCNGCGACRSTSPDVRMCPIFRFSPREEASPRAKANLCAGMLTGRLPPDEMLARRVQRSRRPVRPLPHVPARMPGQRRHPEADARSQGHVRPHERPVAPRPAAGADRRAGRAGRPAAGRRQLGARQSAGPLAAGESARHRPGPQAAAARPPQLSAAMPRCAGSVSRAHGPVEKVVYFVDTYANHFDTQLGRGAGRRAAAQRRGRLRADRPARKPACR